MKACAPRLRTKSSSLARPVALTVGAEDGRELDRERPHSARRRLVTRTRSPGSRPRGQPAPARRSAPPAAASPPRRERPNAAWRPGWRGWHGYVLGGRAVAVEFDQAAYLIAGADASDAVGRARRPCRTSRVRDDRRPVLPVPGSPATVPGQLGEGYRRGMYRDEGLAGPRHGRRGLLVDAVAPGPPRACARSAIIVSTVDLRVIGSARRLQACLPSQARQTSAISRQPGRWSGSDRDR